MYLLAHWFLLRYQRRHSSVISQDVEKPVRNLLLIKSHLQANTYIIFEFNIKDYF